MRTNIEIDDRLMKEAMRASGAATKREAVERALQLLVRATEREKLIRSTRGSIHWRDIEAWERQRFSRQRLSK